MNYILKSLGAIALSTLLLQVASAAQVLDQNSPGQIGHTLTGPETVVQSFIQTANNISGAEISVYLGTGNNPYAPPTAMKITLWSGLPTTVGSAVLAAAAGTYSVSSGFGVFKADWSPVAAIASQIYFLEFESTAPYPMTYFSLSLGDYTSGNIYTTIGTQPYVAAFQGTDLNFKTFQDNQFVSSAPEPSEWALMIVGLGMVGASARKRNMRSA